MKELLTPRDVQSLYGKLDKDQQSDMSDVGVSSTATTPVSQRLRQVAAMHNSESELSGEAVLAAASRCSRISDARNTAGA